MKPLDDDTLYGTDEPVTPGECPLRIEGACPFGCRACVDFYEGLLPADVPRGLRINGSKGGAKVAPERSAES